MFYIFLITLIFLGVVRHRYFWRARFRPTFPKVMAHRGLKIKSPENTIASYQEAVDAGFQGIELDILSIKDKVLICSHNYDLERETNGEGWVHQKKEKELENIKTGIYSHEQNHQSIPTFSDVLRNIPTTIFLNIEIKTKGPFDLSAAKLLAKEIRNKNVNHPFMVSSFNPLVVAYFRLLNPDVSIGFILEDMEWIWVTHWIHPDFFHPRGDLVDDEMLTMSHRHALPLNLWTVNSLPAMDWCKKISINSIITDNPKAVYV